MAFICGRMQNPLNIKTRKSDSRGPDHSYIKPTTMPATYTGNWCRLLLSNTSQAGWRLRRQGWFRWLLRWAQHRTGFYLRSNRRCWIVPKLPFDRKCRFACRLGVVLRRWALTEGYNYTQCSQGNLLFFHYKCQEGKDLQERKGGLFAVSFSEKSSLPLPK